MVKLIFTGELRNDSSNLGKVDYKGQEMCTNILMSVVVRKQMIRRDGYWKVEELYYQRANEEGHKHGDR